MNWLDAVGLAMKVKALLKAWLPAGQTRTETIRTRIAGRMWRFVITAGPEE